MTLAELKRLFARYGLQEAFAEQEALFFWPQVVGPRLAVLAEPLLVREGVLYLQVGSSVLAQELSALRQDYLERLNARLERPLVDLRFKVAARPRPARPAPPPPAASHPEAPAALEAALAEVEDPRLRAALAGWFAALQARSERGSP